MTDWTVHLEFEEGTSSKFWRARVEGKTLYVNWGKIGTNGQTQVKDLADPAAAKREYDKLVAEKRKKGYVDAGAGAARPDDEDDESDAGDAGDDDDGGGDDDEDEAPARKPAAASKARGAAASGASRPSTSVAAPSPVAAAGKPAAAAGKPAAGRRLVLDAGGRKVETTLYLDGNTVRMDSRESHASAEAASKAFERLSKLLGGEGYKPG